MKLPVWYANMNQRERTLATGVAGVVFLLINLFLWNWLLGAIKQSQVELTTLKGTRKEQTVLLTERDLWTKREQWLQQHQPVSKGPGETSTLLENLKGVASKQNILLENPQISTGESTADHQSVFASVEVKCPWEKLVHFLYEVQQPEGFVVFENINLGVDPNDNTQMKGKFKIARWLAPASRKG